MKATSNNVTVAKITSTLNGYKKSERIFKGKIVSILREQDNKHVYAVVHIPSAQGTSFMRVLIPYETSSGAPMFSSLQNTPMRLSVNKNDPLEKRAANVARVLNGYMGADIEFMIKHFHFNVPVEGEGAITEFPANEVGKYVTIIGDSYAACQKIYESNKSVLENSLVSAYFNAKSGVSAADYFKDAKEKLLEARIMVVSAHTIIARCCGVDFKISAAQMHYKYCQFDIPMPDGTMEFNVGQTIQLNLIKYDTKAGESPMLQFTNRITELRVMCEKGLSVSEYIKENARNITVKAEICRTNKTENGTRYSLISDAFNETGEYNIAENIFVQATCSRRLANHEFTNGNHVIVSLTGMVEDGTIALGTILNGTGA